MGCPGCPKPDKEKGIDKRGNIVSAASDMEDYEKRSYDKNPKKDGTHKKLDESIYKMSYKEYVDEKKAHREYARNLGDKAVENFPDDYKRIQVAEMIAIYNHEEVSRLTPDQALVVLWEFVHHKAYQKIVGEFESLSEQVDTKYQELISKKIKVKWKP